VSFQAQEMMTEIQRKDFLNMIGKSDIPSGNWFAVCLLIPTEWLHELNLSDSLAERIIEYGKSILYALPDGSFARIGWSSYFCIVRAGESEIRDILVSQIVTMESQEPKCSLWRFSIMKIGTRPSQEVFTELEWRTHENSRER